MTFSNQIASSKKVELLRADVAKCDTLIHPRGTWSTDIPGKSAELNVQFVNFTFFMVKGPNDATAKNWAVEDPVTVTSSTMRALSFLIVG